MPSSRSLISLVLLSSISMMFLHASSAWAQDDGFFGTDEEALMEELSGADQAEAEALLEGEEDEELEFEAECIRSEPVKKSPYKSCDDGTDCAKWDPPRSNRCDNVYIERDIEVDFEYFGTADCRSSKRKGDISMIVLHNGGSALINYRTWLCRKSASHYTVNRDGSIFQHVGEERRAWHAGKVNDQSIGIELETSIEWKGERCNRLGSKLVKKIAKRDDQTPEEVVRERCEPTDEQYEALAGLIEDIQGRHEIDEIVGHCEVDPPDGTSHSDPRAFDWERIGMSNDAKRDALADTDTSCSWYHVHQDIIIEMDEDEEVDDSAG